MKRNKKKKKETKFIKDKKQFFFLLRVVMGEIDSTIIASLRICNLDVEKTDTFLGMIQDLRKNIGWDSLTLPLLSVEGKGKEKNMGFAHHFLVGMNILKIWILTHPESCAELMRE